MERKTTIKESITTFLNVKYIENKTQSTITAYTNDLENFRSFMKEKHCSIVYVRGFRRKHITEYLIHLTDLLKKGEISAQTKDRRYYTVNSYLQRLVEENEIPKEVLPNIKYQREKKKTRPKPNGLNTIELDIIMDSLAKSDDTNVFRDYALLSVLRYLGIRKEDALEIKWKGVDFNKSTITVYMEKPKLWRELKMHKNLKDALLTHFYASEKNAPSDYMFFSSKDNRLSTSAFKAMFNKVINNSGLEKNFSITPHTFRHSFIYNQVNKNVSLAKIQYYTGHTDINTLKDYVDLSELDYSDLLEAM